MNLTTIIKKLSTYQPKQLKETTPSAAVMVMLLEETSGNIEILLTKRAETLLTYAGHISFPGGMREPLDKSLFETGVRETKEELNINREQYECLGTLDDFKDRFDHLVRPFVVTMKKQQFLKSHRESSDEVSSIHVIPITTLHKLEDNPELHSMTRRRPSYSYQTNEFFLWGLTATILVHFSNIIFDENRPLGKNI